MASVEAPGASREAPLARCLSMPCVVLSFGLFLAGCFVCRTGQARGVRECPPPPPLGREAYAQGSQEASRGLVRGPRERSGTRFEAYQSWSAARYITISPLARGPARTRSFDASRCLSMPCIVLSFGFPCLFEWRSNCYRESL